MNSSLLTANLWTMALNLAYSLIALFVGALVFRVIDRVVFPDIDFVSEMKKGNLAAGLFAGAILLFIAVVIAGVAR